MAYNTSIQSTTGQFPFLLMFSQRARIPVHMLFGMEWAQVTDGVEVGEYMAKQSRILQEAYSYVQDTMRNCIRIDRKSCMTGKDMANPLKLVIR